MSKVIIVGSGIAGLNSALECVRQGLEVILLTKKKIKNSATHLAQGGVAAVLDSEDSFEKHIQDTLEAGSYHNKKKVVKDIVECGPQVISELQKLEVKFATSKTGDLALTQEGGHTYRRIAFVGDHTGKEIEVALSKAVLKEEKITVVEDALVLDLLVEEQAVQGVWCFRRGKVEFFEGEVVILATGGIGQVYANSSNPRVSTGDGIAIALRAGAEIFDMEFVQFHPTVFFSQKTGAFLISEAVRGEGAWLVNSSGERFVDELSSRDKVSAAIFKELQTNQVYLDCRHLSRKFLVERFPTIYQTLLKQDLRLEKDLMKIAPAAHYLCGGIKTNLNGETNIAGLLAVGECAWTGFHGANRLASNSLLEAMAVSGKLALPALSESRLKATAKVRPKLKLAVVGSPRGRIKKLQELMWTSVGIVRNLHEVKRCLQILEEWQKEIQYSQEVVDLDSIKYANMLQVALEIAGAAYKRKKSLGCHFLAALSPASLPVAHEACKLNPPV